MARKQKILKKKGKVYSTCESLMKYTNFVNEIKRDRNDQTMLPHGVDCRDLKGMSYIFLALNPKITDEEFKAKTRDLYEAFFDGYDTLTKEEIEARQKPYLDMLFNFQASYKDLVRDAKNNNYLGLIVYCFLSQTFGVKKNENQDYFKRKINSCEAQRTQDAIERRTIDFIFDLTDDIKASGVEPNKFIDCSIASPHVVDEEDMEEHYKIAVARESRLDQAALKALDLQDKTRDYLELDVVKDIYDFTRNISNTLEDIGNDEKSVDLILTSEHLVLKIIGEDTNEKMLNKTLFGNDTNLFTNSIYLDGKPLIDYVPDEIKNMNIKDETGKIDHNMESRRERLIMKSKSLIILQAIESADKHIDIVRMNSYEGELAYQIQPVKLKYNQKEYKETHYFKWWQRLFGIGVKNIQKSFDRVYNDKSSEALRLQSISKHYESKVMSMNNDIKHIRKFSDSLDGQVVNTNKVIGVQKDIEELKNDNVISTNLSANLNEEKDLTNDDFELEIK